MVRKILMCGALALCAAMTDAAVVDTGNAVLNERVRTLEVKPVGEEYCMPGAAMMVLGSGGGITVEFDVLGDDREYLRYELVHCNADWQPSQLAYIEYLDGFNEGFIEDYEYSQGTTVHYVHYAFTIPNADVRLKATGNYLIKIYPEGDPDEVWAQCRFVVTDQTAVVGGMITGRTDVDFNKQHQQLELSVDVERAGVSDIFNDVTVVIEQNGRSDNRAVLTKPLRVSGRTLVYEHLPQLIFKGGNEYRRFENVAVNYPGMGVEEVLWSGPYYHAVLSTDASRAGESYHYDETLSGGFVVREYNSDHSDTEADYVVTHFTLDYPETPGFDFYIDGEFTNRRFSPESRMVYNRGTGRYEHAMLLKQGAYSYQYLAVAPGTDTGRTDILEGDHFETRNRYRVYVYVRRMNERADRLVAVRDLDF